MDLSGKKISILGDSISTFKGVTTDDPNTFYGRVMMEKGGFSGVADTWWMRTITALGGVPGRVNAFAGSCVAEGYGLGLGMSSLSRTGALGDPDAVFIFGGANDLGFGVSEAEFRRAYALMLTRLKEYCPAAVIFCGTLINGRKVLPDEPYFMGEKPGKELEPFSSVIRDCARAAGAHVVDMAASGLVYDAIDGCHPTASGMAQLAELWIEAVRGA